MTKRMKNNRKLVNLGLYQNKIVYYDLKEKRLYFSILERTSKNQHYYTLGLTLLSLPIIRLLNGLTIFDIPTIKYSSFILCSCLSFISGIVYRYWVLRVLRNSKEKWKSCFLIYLY